MRPVAGTDAGADYLASVEADFPHYRFWREAVRNQTRYVARSRYGGVHPHTVVTTDLAELRDALGDAPAQPQSAACQADSGPPTIAGMYNRWLGGKDNGIADRLAADDVLAGFPAVAQVARFNREFVIRAVAHVAAAGISQFLDIGTGLPATPAIHHIARHADPSARVCYVDNDPVVIAHARALLAGPGIAVVAGDMRQPGTILAEPELTGLIDLSQPFCVILASVLHFAEPAEAAAVAAAFTTAITPGSYLILSAGTSTGTDPDLITRLQAAYQGTTVVTGRTDTEIAGYLTGLDLLPPGLTDVQHWRSDHRAEPPTAAARILGAVGRKPARPRSRPQTRGAS
jgi:SAM-dependent methyltransferase